MTLAVIGTMDAALAAAAWAGASSRERILLLGWAPDTAPTLSQAVVNGITGPITVDAVVDEGADAYLIVAGSAEQPALFAEYADRLAGRPVMLAPTSIGGALAAAELFATMPVEAPRFAEAPGFPVLGSVSGSTVRISAIKRNLPFAAVDAQHASADLATFRRYFPDLLGSDLVTTGLSNTNNLIHPPMVVANAAAISAGTPFRFYREGVNDVATALMERIDRERLAVLDRLEVKGASLVDLMAGFYGDQGMSGTTIGEQLRGFVPFEDSPAPSTLQHRYLLEDVPFGLAPLEAMAVKLGVAAPALGEVVDQASALVGADLRSHGEARAALLLACFS